jgi:SAM-dependent methyltransferase
MSFEDANAQRYVDAWITNEESGKDVERIRHIDPYLRLRVQSAQDDINVLDVGCGWGKIVESLKPNQRYTGLDPYLGFLEYVRRRYQRPNLTLLHGNLPDNLPVPEESYDEVLCSMVLHCVSDARKSVDAVFSKAKMGASVTFVMFGDSAKQPLIDSATHIDHLDENRLHGLVKLSSGYEVETDIHFHTEHCIEEYIAKHGEWIKRALGELFIAYECVKQRN